MPTGIPHPCVIVGLDATPTGLAALRVAVDEARLRGLPLCTVRASTTDFAPASPETTREALRQALGAIPSDLNICQLSPMLTVRQALRDAAAHPCDLLVVGTSGRGGWHSIWSGSVARGQLRRPRCAVLAVPGPEMARGLRGLRRRRWLRGNVWRRFERAPDSRGG